MLIYCVFIDTRSKPIINIHNEHKNISIVKDLAPTSMSIFIYLGRIGDKIVYIELVSCACSSNYIKGIDQYF